MDSKDAFFKTGTTNDHTTNQIDSLATPFIFLWDYEECREETGLIRDVNMQIYKRNKRRMIKAYYRYNIVNGMNIREFRNISLAYQRESFWFSVPWSISY